jgi:DnaK suppressor protein
MNPQASAMPAVVFKSHYLTSDQLEYFFCTLTDWRRRLQKEYTESRLRLRMQEDTGGDLIDQSTKDSVRVMEMLQGNRKQQLIAQVDAALQRIMDGSYGYCQVTDEEIGYERLRAYPIATLSITTQEHLELRHHWKS